ncbi:MAG: phosphatidate cytidylyltransferase [Lachnospiraceae bacterium]
MFKTRLFSSIILVFIAMTTIISGNIILAVTLWAISIVAFIELSLACGVATTRKDSLFGVGYLAITAYYVALYFTQSEEILILPIIIAFFGFLFVYVFAFPKYKAEQIMAAFFVLFYAPVMFSFVYLTRQLEYGIYLVWMIFIASWISDTCAYLVGMLLGRHKLAPILSPKKSIEGAIGGVVGSAIVGAIYGFILVENIIIDQKVTLIFAVLGASGSLISQMGDLAASAIKRNNEIKDYGNLIPGHGGIMDRFDSVIITAPMIYFLSILLIHEIK